MAERRGVIDGGSLMRDQRFRVLLRYTVGASLACAIAVVACYFFVDRPVAFYVHNHGLDEYRVLKWLTYPPPWMQSWSPLVLAILIVRRARGPWRRWQLALLVACVSLLIADQFRSSLGDLLGRYWPETWHDNNPSLIGTGTYGFHAFEYGGFYPFQPGDDTGSFPSGHAARICGFFSVFWLVMPSGRWLYAIASLPILVALVGMNYHFVSDVIAGSVLGAVIGAYAVMLAGFDRSESPAGR